MTFQEIQELIKLISKSNLAEFKLKDGEFKLSIRTSLYKETRTTQVVSAPVSLPATPAAAGNAAAPPAQAAPAPQASSSQHTETTAPGAAPEKKFLEVKSPMVGTFYRSSSPEKPTYVEIGQKVKKGDVVCIIEAMKLFNEIETDFSGTIVKAMVDNAQPVEYDQVLFLVEPD